MDLPGAIGAADGVAAAVEERAGDILEKDAGAEAHGNVVYVEHLWIIITCNEEFRAIRGVTLAAERVGRLDCAAHGQCD